MSSANSVIILHILILIIALFSGIRQIIVVSSTAYHKCLPLGMLSLSILSHVLNIIVLGFTDLRSDLHYAVLGCAVLTGSLQVVALGLLVRSDVILGEASQNLTGLVGVDRIGRAGEAQDSARAVTAVFQR